ncbi:MAG: hypothetical protein FE047_01450 [Thermoplasmata archaeon]|nr:MAG: hypothetical protein FE047_01450 [Thermoplasmata archaeon]
MIEESKRKLIHLSFGIAFAILFYFHPFYLLLFFISSTIISFIFSLFGNEWNRVFWYFLAVSIISISYTYIPKSIIVSSMLIFAIGDTFSNIMGRKYGKKKWPHSNKTCIGTITGIILSFPFAYVFTNNLIIAAIGAISGMFAEAYSPVNDNFMIPLASFVSMSIIWII